RLTRPLPWVILFHQIRVFTDRGLLLTPAVVMSLLGALFLVQSAMWAFQRRWRGIMLLSVVFVVMVPVIAMILLRADAADKGPLEQYSWVGWYWLGMFGASSAGALVLTRLGFFAMLKLARRVGCFRGVSVRPVV